MFMFSPLYTDVFVVLQIYIYAYSFRDNSTCGLLYRIISIFRSILLQE